MHKYWGFGLNILSEIEFPELFPIDFSIPDVTVTVGEVPLELKGEDVIQKVRMSASPVEYLLDVNNIAKYYVANGTRIIIQPDPSSDIASVRLFMLSNAMAAVLHQQGKITFHASGILTGNGLILFTGRSGVGKSTTLCGLMNNGYKIFTDDVCVLSYNDKTNKVEACASYPMMKLWENTITQLSVQKNKSHKLRPDLAKYGFMQHKDFKTDKFPIEQIYILKTSSIQPHYSYRKLDTVEAFNQLQQNTYRRRQIDLMKLHKPHFKIISQLTKSAKTFEVIRSQNSDDIKGYLDHITNLISSNG